MSARQGDEGWAEPRERAQVRAASLGGALLRVCDRALLLAGGAALLLALGGALLLACGSAGQRAEPASASRDAEAVETSGAPRPKSEAEEEFPSRLVAERANSERTRLANARHGLSCGKKPSGYGCSDSSGKEIIPFRYEVPFEFGAAGFAITFERGRGWIYVDARHERKLTALTLDAEPDEAYGVPARIEEGGKIGFLDPRRGVVIPPRFDAAFPFDGGRALVCVGCHPQRWSKRAPPEARCTGEAFFIDVSGARLPDAPELGDCPAPGSDGARER